MSLLTMNGTSSVSPSLSADDSEESFVVLSPSLAPDHMEQLMSLNASMVNSTVSALGNIPISQEVSSFR